jgi:PAS domain S-box-containing protein
LTDDELAGAKATKVDIDEKAGGAKRSSSTESNMKPRSASQAYVVSSSMSSGGDDSGNQVDSNIASSSSGSEEVNHISRRRSMDQEDDGPSSSSISSNGAAKNVQVMASIRSPEAGHADVVIQNNKKRKAAPSEALTSLEENFELDYEEVFLNSNVPQILATTSGKVVAWNDFFLRATGFSKREMEHLTIFSLVQSSDLSSVFEIVAAALRTNALPAHEDTHIESSEKNTGSTELNAPQWDYEAMTLPCVNFRALREGPEEKKAKLNMTLTLMPDEDPRKRCFHGVFTDYTAGKKGALGTISPELLSLLSNQKDEHRHHASKRRRHHVSKRAKPSIKECKEEFP